MQADGPVSWRNPWRAKGNTKKSAPVLAKRWSVPWKLIFFQEEDVTQDRFVVHLKPYHDIRELLAKGVISGNIEDITAALTVRISTIIWIHIKHLITGPEVNSEFCFPRISLFPETKSRETERFEGSKIYCFPRDQSLSDLLYSKTK